MKRPRVVVTGLGVVSSVGIGWQAFWESLLAGRSGISKIDYVDTADYPTQYGGEVKNFDPLQFMPPEVARRLGRGAQMAIVATKLALEDAKLSRDQLAACRAGVCLGTTMADIQALENANSEWVERGERHIRSAWAAQYPSCTISAHVGSFFELRGPNYMIPNACAAGNYAIGYAYDLLRLGKADIMLAGGAEPFSRTVFEGFNRVLAVAPERCQPFDKNRKGMLPGEGAGILILERLEDALVHRAPIYAEILGYGLNCDASHMTIPNVDGVRQVMVAALRDAELKPSDVDYISAHGTGTLVNDKTECAAIRAVFESHSDDILVSSAKSMLGHTMGAASALEAIACCLTVKLGYATPTINFETRDPECNVNCVPNTSRKHDVKVALKNAFAFGGNNAALVFGKVIVKDGRTYQRHSK